MKTKSSAVLLAAFMSLSAMGGAFINVSPSDAKARQVILRLLQERRDAFYDGDFDKFQEYEAEDFTRISEDGSFSTKQEQVAYLKSLGAERKTSDARVIYADHDLKLDVLGTVAVLTGTLSETESSGASPHETQSRFTEVWVFQLGRWRTLHNHYTSIGSVR